MYNVTKPTLDDLPTSKQLLRSTLIALVAAFAILIAIVLPSEYGSDPTGIGRVLGLSEMGEIKTQLAEEAAADAARDAALAAEGAEVKLSMKTGEQAQFSWVAEGGVVNFDTHGDGGGGGQSISYEKGRAVPGDDGVLEAAFDGNHGWFWRNRDSADVTVIIRTRGQYTEMKRVL